MLEMLMMGVIFFVAIVAVSIGIGKWLRYNRLKLFEEEVDEVIEEYRGRLNDSNRFLVNEAWLADAFPEYDRDDVREVWKRIVARKLVDRDPLDSEMCLRK